jgi:hypothetical protein
LEVERMEVLLRIRKCKQEGVVETVLTKEPILISIRLTNWERKLLLKVR